MSGDDFDDDLKEAYKEGFEEGSGANGSFF